MSDVMDERLKILIAELEYFIHGGVVSQDILLRLCREARDELKRLNEENSLLTPCLDEVILYGDKAEALEQQVELLSEAWKATLTECTKLANDLGDLSVDYDKLSRRYVSAVRERDVAIGLLGGMSSG